MKYQLITIVLGYLLLINSINSADNYVFAANQRSLAKASFSDPHPVKIKGLPLGAYRKPISTEEPFISRDGRFLFFNSGKNENHKDLHYAELIKKKWVYRGQMGSDINTKKFVEANPTMDENNNFFYIDTSVHRMVSLAKFSPETGQLSGKGEFRNIPSRQMKIVDNKLHGNMGVEISADGKTLYFSRAVWELRDKDVGRVLSSNVFFLVKKNRDYFFDRMQSRKIMQNINTSDLEYAASISSDGLELFFTRISLEAFKKGKIRSKIMHSTRSSLSLPFNPPQMIKSIGAADFVEGPALTNNNKELYYHKYNGSKFRLFKVKRYN